MLCCVELCYVVQCHIHKQGFWLGWHALSNRDVVGLNPVFDITFQRSNLERLIMGPAPE